MGNDCVIKIENVNKIYRLYKSKQDRFKEALHPFKKKYHKDFYALKNFSISIEKGVFLGILGKNGSGKSTLLKVISNVLKQSSGHVVTNGKVVALLELGAGFNPEFTGIENIYFYSSLLGYRRKEIDEMLPGILDFADIGEFIYQPIKTYSSGMKARLAFAVSVNIDPDILIVDEVLAVGDVLFKRKCYDKIQEFIKKNKTILLVTHSIRDVIDFCNRAIIIDEGEMVIDGEPKVVVSEYEKLLYTTGRKRRNEIKKQIKDLNINNNGSVVKNEAPAMPEKKLEHCFIPDLISKTTRINRHADVDIFDVSFTTIDKQKVNVLIMDQTYYYNYRVKFNQDFENVNFGMLFRNVKGVEISGEVFPGKRGSTMRYKKGDEFLVSWKFTCKLLPGMYFGNAAVSRTVNNEIKRLIGVFDAIAFKVKEIPNITKFGLVNINQELLIE